VKSAGDRLLMMGAIRLVGLTYGLVMLPFVPRPSAVTWMWLALATVAVFAYYGLLIQSYRIGDMSFVYLVARGAAPILLALIAFLTIDERLDLLQIAAVTLTSAGILLLAVGKGGDRIAIALAIATGISIAAYSFFGALGVRVSADVMGFQAWLEILTGLGMLSFIAMRRWSAIGAFVRVNYRTGLLAGILPVLHTGDLERDLIQRPLVAKPGKTTTDLVGERLAEFARPLPHGFVADDDVTRGQQLLHHTQTEREAEIQPNGVADDLGWESIAGVAGGSGCPHPTRLPFPARPRKPPRRSKLTVPLQVLGLTLVR
jgi:multidrug transporter EmrE-like cation transporter